eukprot:751707-Hanusia_phi.AAC.2
MDERGASIVLHNEGRVDLWSTSSEFPVRSFHVCGETLQDVRSVCISGDFLVFCMESSCFLIVRTSAASKEVPAWRFSLPQPADFACINTDEDLIALATPDSIHMCFPTHSHDVLALNMQLLLAV